MTDRLRSAAQLPPEYLLPVVTAETINQARKPDASYDCRLKALTVTNIELITWIRTEATKTFPDDLSARRKAFGIVIAALGLVEEQQVKDTLQERMGFLPPANDEIWPAA